MASMLPDRLGMDKTGGPAPAKSDFASGSASVGKAGGGDFASMLDHMVQEVNTKQSAATDAVAALQSGQAVSLHQAMIAMEEASVSFQLMVEVRNKLLESYQEVMRMQI